MATLAAAILGLALFSGSAGAAFTATGWSLVPTTSQAGAHPGVSMKATTDPAAADLTGDDLSSLQLDLPAGLLMNPQAVGTPCPTAYFNADRCSAATQVGNITVSYRVYGKIYSSTGSIYSITPDSNSLINFGFVVRPTGFQKLLFTSGRATGLATVRQGLDKDYGLSISVPNIPRTIRTTLGFSTAMTIGSIQLDFFARSGSTQSGPYFVYNPTRCDAAGSKATFTSYAGVTQSQSASFTPTGCDQLNFDPTFTIAGSNTDAGQPTGISATVTMPTAEQAIQETDVSGVTVYLPRGMTINLGVLNDTGLCTDAQLAVDACPASSRIGSATVSVPMLPAAMTGDIYLQQRELPTSFAYVLRGARGTLAILRGSVDIGSTGLVATLQTLPQVPWSSATLNFTTLVLNNPRSSCPNATAWGDVTGWNGSEAILGELMPQTNCPPDTSITASPSSPTNQKTPKFSFASDQTDATFECSVDDGAYAPCAAPFTTPTLGEGSHTFAVRAVGSTGAVDPTPASVDFTVDLTPPVITYSSPAAGSTVTSDTVSLNFTTEPDAANYCRLDNLGIYDCVDSYTFTNVADGPHKIRVISRDLAGNISFKDLAFTVATIRPPVVTLTSPADGATLPTNRAVMQFSATSPNGTAITSVTCSFFIEYPDYGFEIPDGDARPCTPGQEFRLDENQSYRVQVDATDALGNVGSADVLFTTAITPPQAPGVVEAEDISGVSTTERTPTWDLEYGSSDWPDRQFDCSLVQTGSAPEWKLCGTPGDLPPYTPAAPLTNGEWTFSTRTRSGDVIGDRLDMQFTVGDWSAQTTATTTTQQAGAHPDLDVGIVPTGAGQLHSVDFSLPKGLIGSLNSFPECPAANIPTGTCPADTKIGSVNVKFTIHSGIDIKPTVGDVYYTGPQAAGDVAGMVIRVYGPIKPYADVIIPLRIQLLNNAQTMRVFSDSIPTDVGNIYDATKFIKFWVINFQMHIDGSTGSPYPLLTNPSSCAAGQFSAVTGDIPGNKTAAQTIAYQPVGCGSLQYAPTLTQVFTSPVAGGRTGVVADIDLPAGNSSMRSVRVTEPPALGPSYPSFGQASDQCPSSSASTPSAVFDPSACKPQSVVGTMSVDSPLLAEPLTGKVYLINKSPLPWLGVDLEGSGISVRLVGTTSLPNVDPACDPETDPSGFCQTQIQVTFANLPDLPLTHIKLTLHSADRTGEGGATLPGDILTVADPTSPLCQPGVLAKMTFVSNSGSPTVNATQPVPLTGCTG